MVHIADLVAISAVFIKLGSQLTAEKLTDLAIIPVIFIVQTCVSYFCAFVVSRCCRFKKRQSNFVAAMAVRSHLIVPKATMLIAAMLN